MKGARSCSRWRNWKGWSSRNRIRGARGKTGIGKTRVCRVLGEVDYEPRVVVIMHDMDGAEMKDIARELDVPLTTGFWRLRVGRQQFQRRPNVREPGSPKRSARFFPVPFDVATFLAAHREPPEPPASARDRIMEALSRMPPRGVPSGPAEPDRGPARAVARAVAGQTPGFIVGGAVMWALLKGVPSPPRARDLAPVQNVTVAADASALPVAWHERRADGRRRADPPLARRSPPPPAAPRPAAGAPSGDHEAWLIGAALADLDAKRPRDALRWIDEHARRFPDGSMKASAKGSGRMRWLLSTPQRSSRRIDIVPAISL